MSTTGNENDDVQVDIVNIRDSQPEWLAQHFPEGAIEADPAFWRLTPEERAAKFPGGGERSTPEFWAGFDF